MIKHLRIAVVVLAILIAFAAGCASTKQYTRFAQAGTIYTGAVDKLLLVVGNTGVDATSWRLLQDDAIKNQDLESYEKLSSIDKERLVIISSLRTHARLLERYFSLLNELATSDDVHADI
jgi:hypothetical protein